MDNTLVPDGIPATNRVNSTSNRFMGKPVLKKRLKKLAQKKRAK